MKEIKKIEQGGSSPNLILGIMDNGKLCISVEEWTKAGRVRHSIYLDKSNIYSISEALKEIVKIGNGGQLPLWW
jgi:hypothetical protein